MSTIDKLERVASLALHAKPGTSAYSVADIATKLQRLGSMTHRLGVAVINGEIPSDKGHAQIAKCVAKAREILEPHGLTADDSDDGYGYLEISQMDRAYRPGTLRVIACFPW